LLLALGLGEPFLPRKPSVSFLGVSVHVNIKRTASTAVAQRSVIREEENKKDIKRRSFENAPLAPLDLEERQITV